jgi:hypothetical protein
MAMRPQSSVCVCVRAHARTHPGPYVPHPTSIKENGSEFARFGDDLFIDMRKGCVCEREREGERESVCVCVRERETESVVVCEHT